MNLFTFFIVALLIIGIGWLALKLVDAFVEMCGALGRMVGAVLAIGFVVGLLELLLTRS